MKVSKLVKTINKALEDDPKLSLARVRLLLLISQYEGKGTSTQLANDLDVDKKYFRKFAGEAEKAGYLTRERFSDMPADGDCLHYKLTEKGTKLLKELFQVKG